MELAQVHQVSPPGLEKLLVGNYGPGNHANHVSYTVDDPEQEGGRLEALGMKRFWYARKGPLEIFYYDSTDLLGQVIEVHRHSAAFDGLFGLLDAAAQDWDGHDPLRHLPE